MIRKFFVKEFSSYIERFKSYERSKKKLARRVSVGRPSASHGCLRPPTQATMPKGRKKFLPAKKNKLSQRELAIREMA